jgi:hypothetical protein
MITEQRGQSEAAILLGVLLTTGPEIALIDQMLRQRQDAIASQAAAAQVGEQLDAPVGRCRLPECGRWDTGRSTPSSTPVESPAPRSAPASPHRPRRDQPPTLRHRRSRGRDEFGEPRGRRQRFCATSPESLATVGKPTCHRWFTHGVVCLTPLERGGSGRHDRISRSVARRRETVFTYAGLRLCQLRGFWTAIL